MSKYTVYSYELRDMFKAITNAGADPIKDDYILVVGTEAQLNEITSPVQIVRDPQANGSAYLVQRKNYYQEETN